MTKTKRKKRLLKLLKKITHCQQNLERLAQEGRKLGFKTSEEYSVWLELEKKGIRAKHNVRVGGHEVDIFIEPDMIIEVGFLDKNLKKTWERAEEGGYKVLYFSNLEVREKAILRRTIDKIVETVKAQAPKTGTQVGLMTRLDTRRSKAEVTPIVSNG